MTAQERAPLFCDGNKPFWMLIRRLLLSVVREIERQYNMRGCD